MCPTYRAADEEIQSTRGRANLLRQAMSGDLPEGEQFSEEFMHEVLDVCVGCKGCVRDCPSEVDMAKLKVELAHEHHRREGSSLRERAFANVSRLSALGSALAPVSNWVGRSRPARWLLERVAGVASAPSLPTFHRETLTDWFEARGGPAVDADGATRRAVLVPDAFTEYSRPEQGRAAVGLLEAAGVRVELADVDDVGRPAYSKGFLDVARERAREAVDDLAPRVADGRDVVVVEPSDAVMLQDECRDLLSGDGVDAVADNSYGVLEYVDAFRLDDALAFDPPGRSLTYHGHCHQKAAKRDHHAVGVLRRAGYEVDPLDSGCCGMAGSFGYEAEHRGLSEAIAEILFEQVEASPGGEVVAPGASCRTQLGDRDGADAPRHPVEAVVDALA
jgi:Fe-S oxidoreductase